MKNKILTIAQQNTSFLLIALGAGCNFLLILFLKKFLPETFNDYSLYLTFLGIIASFGFFGIDQVFLRLSSDQKGKVSIGKDLFILMLIAFFLIPVVIAFYFAFNYSTLSNINLILSGISINAIILVYNVFRLQKKFVISQVFKSGYRIAFFIGIFILFFAALGTLENIIFYSTMALSVMAIFALFLIKNKIIVNNLKTAYLYKFMLSFSLNLAVLTLIGFGERILIANEIDKDTFGKYFYYSTIFLFPLTLVQQYVGFKELVFFKEKIDKSLIVKKLKKIISIGIFILVLIFLIVIIDNNYFLEIDLRADKLLIVLLSSLGLIKLLYGLFSAILGAKGNYKDIYLLNFLSVATILLILLFLFNTTITLNGIVVGLILIYLLRSVYIFIKYAK